MKAIILTVSALAALAFTPSQTKNYVFDVNGSDLHWYATKVTGKHDGKIKLKSGEVSLDGDKLTAANFTIDMNSITCVDLTDPGYNEKLVGHLKADDFFATDKFPEARFTMTKATLSSKESAGNKYSIDGQLTVKGVTQPISFPATIVSSGNLLTAIGKITVDRTKFGIKYGSKSFIEGIGDKAIDDNFNLEIKLTGKAK